MRLRKPAVPADVLQQLDLAPKERVLAWARDVDGRPVIASEQAVHLQRVPPVFTRIGWEQIEHVSYEAGAMTITLGSDFDSATLRVPLDDSRDLPVAIRDRVTASVVVDRFVPLRDDRGVRIVGRRTGSGVIVWRADLDSSLNDDEASVTAASQALDEIRSEVSGH